MFQQILRKIGNFLKYIYREGTYQQCLLQALCGADAMLQKLYLKYLKHFAILSFETSLGIVNGNQGLYSL